MRIRAASAARCRAAVIAAAREPAAVDAVFLLIILALLAVTLWLVRAIERLGSGE
jgi:hypothetical protein